MKLSVVIPMYNESEIIKNTAISLSDYMQKNFESYEIIFSDDGSSDKSAEIIKSLSLDSVFVIESKENHGKGSAVRAGVNKAEGDIILFTDADLAYGTGVIGKAYDVILKSECDMLIGSRNIEKGSYGKYPRLREMFSKMYVKVICLIAGTDISDSQCGFKLFKKDIAKKVFSLSEMNGFSFDLEIIMLAKKAGANIDELPVKITTHSKSSVSILRDGIKMLCDLVKIKRRVRKIEL